MAEYKSDLLIWKAS